MYVALVYLQPRFSIPFPLLPVHFDKFASSKIFLFLQLTYLFDLPAVPSRVLRPSTARRNYILALIYELFLSSYFYFSSNIPFYSVDIFSLLVGSLPSIR